MRVATVALGDIVGPGRLDASYHLSPGVQAGKLVDDAAARGSDVRLVGGAEGLAGVWQPGRFKRQYAAPGELGVPYLKPYDIFDYVPSANDFLSVRRSDNLSELLLDRDTILVTCSGRNLGPAVVVDAYLRRFALSHDVIRLVVPDEVSRWFLLAYLNSPTGQEQVRRDRSGSVIDHINPDDIASLRVPMLDERSRRAIAAMAKAAARARERARLSLDLLIAEVAATIPAPDAGRPAEGWEVASASLTDRLDAAPYSPKARKVAAALESRGGRALREVAKVRKPASRYKAYHVDADHGHPFLAGGQLRQWTVIGAKYMADRVFADPDFYRLYTNEVAFAADGRAYGGLGLPVLVTRDRNKWLASEHVMRLQPVDGISAGWLYAVVATPQVQEQIQVLACGSVVDTLYVDAVENIRVPAPLGRQVELGEEVAVAWDLFATAQALSDKAVDLLEACLRGGSLRTRGSWSRLEADEWQALTRLLPTAEGQPVPAASGRTITAALALVQQTFAASPPIGSNNAASYGGTIKARFANSVIVTVEPEDHAAPYDVELPMSNIHSQDPALIAPGARVLWRVGEGGSTATVLAIEPLSEEQVVEAMAWAREAAALMNVELEDRAIEG